MNNELLTVLNYMEKEKGLDREILITAVEDALRSAARKTMGFGEDLRVVIDRKTCEIRAFANSVVTESGTPNIQEVTLERARKTNPAVKVGDVVQVEVQTRELGRIAAQTAKQAIIQRIRQAERDVLFDEYKDQIGDIVSGAVRQFNRGDIVVDLGRAEATMPASERVQTEEYQVGDRIRAYVLAVQHEGGGPAIMLSRAHPNFVRRLFELEVSEIADGVVEIKAIAREPGYRTKLAVISHDPKVDPVGACVGMRGMRVKNVVRELAGEKIDIIRWSDDLKTYATNALSPAKLSNLVIDDGPPRVIRVTVDNDQLSLAIGKRGQNVRLTSRLLGLKVDIQRNESEISFEEKVARAIDGLAKLEQISRAEADRLVNAGFLTVEGILAVEAEELQEMTDFDAETARRIHDAAATAQSRQEGTETHEST
ncbi:MAG: transcription termination factor NusA [Lentisphaerae bacterium RIFOXYB12_FULL_60_10]|nr:MAG: transcription termination factor NusA [Lentisphaerae bacterium RIFOXYA12_FULL_60_10]OGV79936.1 MAG: transcription termination factor NusA [Lentisphaerae bacterium RIFOXYB12_FULL_60_10]